MLKKSVFAILILIMLVHSVCSIVVMADTGNPFDDVKEGAWYYDDVLSIYNSNVMKGTKTDKFEPDTTLTREMFVTILGRFHGKSDLAYALTPFKDTKNDKWYSAHILWAADKGIVSGITDEVFGINQPITREQMATLIARYCRQQLIKLPKDETATPFIDTPSAYAADAVELMRVTGIIKGRGNDYFEPEGYATRAEAATVLARFIKALENAKYEFSFDDDNIKTIKITNVNNQSVQEITVVDPDIIKQVVQYLNNVTITSRVTDPGVDGGGYSISISTKDGAVIGGRITESSIWIDGYLYTFECNDFITKVLELV